MTVVRWPKIILFGDSLTQNAFEPINGLWGSVIADKLQRKCDLVTRGFSGYNSKNCRTILPQLFDRVSLQDVTGFGIFLGANDAAIPPSTQHVPLEEYKENLKAIADYVISLGLSKEQLFFISPPPYKHQAWVEACVKKGESAENVFRNETNTELYAEACISVAKANNIAFVDLFKTFMDQPEWKSLFSDGLHFSHKGALLVADLLWPLIEKRCSNGRELFPYWKDL